MCFFSRKGGILEGRVAITLVRGRRVGGGVSRDTQGAVMEEGSAGSGARGEGGGCGVSREVREEPVWQ